MPDSRTISAADQSRHRGLLGRFAPAIIAICLLLDISLRFVPPRFFAFRAWEAMHRLGPGKGPFLANASYRNPRAYGDLANIANLPQNRQFHEEEFHTDGAGYRNRQTPARPFRGILLVGDSFAAGAGVPDEQSLGEQISKATGLAVYNAAGAYNVAKLVTELEMEQGLVIWQQSERTAIPLPSVPRARGAKRTWRGRIQELKQQATFRYSGYWHYSPLGIVFGRPVRLLQNDRVLPNPSRGSVFVAKLQNWREMLFAWPEVANYDRDRPAPAEYFVRLNGRLEQKGLRLLVLLVPDKYVVYHDLIVPAQRPADRMPYFSIVEQHMADADVPVLNLVPLFRKRAAELLPGDDYLYWLDDSHWNARGIHEAAEAIAEKIGLSAGSATSTRTPER